LFAPDCQGHFCDLIMLMPTVVSDVANNLFEIGKGVVAGTAGAVADIALGTVEQITPSPSSTTTQNTPKTENSELGDSESKKLMEKQRFEAVKGELALYIKRKKQLDQKIAQEKAMESRQVEQKDALNKKEHESWVSKVINRSQTTTERGRLAE
jgi:hypothetical protein